MKRELFGIAAGARHYEHIHVAVAVGRKRNPFPVGRESGINVSRFIYGYAFDIPPILIGCPDVSQICEHDSSLMIVRVPNEPGFAAQGTRRHPQREQKSESKESFHGVSFKRSERD